MKLFKRFMALALICTMITSFCAPAALAAGGAGNDREVTYTAKLDQPTINESSAEQPVVMTVEASVSVGTDAMGMTVMIPEGWTLKAIENEVLGFAASNVNLANGKVNYVTADAENWPTQLIVKVTYNVPANAAAGTYELGIKDLVISEDYGSVWEEDGDPITTTLIIAEKTHAWNEGEWLQEPTCTTDGVKKYTCTGAECNCGTTKTETVIGSQLGHDWNEVVYAGDGITSYTAERTCKRLCNAGVAYKETATAAITSEITKPTSCAEEGVTTYTATFAEAWATGKTTNESIAKLAHTYGAAVFTWTGDGQSATASITCSVCTAEAEGHVLSGNAGVEVKSSTAGDCMTAGTTTYEATITLNGTVYTDTKTVNGAIGDHEWDTVTYTGDGKTSYVAERVCKLNPAHTETANATITSEVKTPATCEDKGWTTYTATFTETWATGKTTDVEDIDALDHDWTVEYDFAADGSACTATRVCGNDAAHNVTVDATVTSAEKTPATCTEKGWTTYTATFTAAWAENQTLDVQDINALDHDWDATTYDFAADGKTCTATRICKRDGSHVETVNATITSEITVQPGCNSKGTTTYTAAFAVAWAETQTKAVEDIDATGEHNYAYSVTYTWSDNHQTCTAVGKCSCNTTAEATATVTSEVTKAATCVDKGETTYTATFDAEWAETQTEVVADIPVDNTAHTWTVEYNFADDGSACTATHVCGRDAAHNVTVNATIASEVKTPATCEEKGVTTYTATFAESWAETQTKDVEDIAALDHAWTVEYNFAENGKACTATHICGNDAQHNVVLNATITSEVKTAATCEGMGVTTYTATFSESWAATQTKDVEDIPALNHAWTVTYDFAADGSACTAERVCGNDASHKDTAVAAITDAVKTPATCSAKGVTTYTATFAEDWAETQTKDVEDIAIDANAHKWNSGVVTTPATCMAEGEKTFTCQHNAAHTKTEPVPVNANAHQWNEGEITKAPTCTAEGEKTFTCELNADHKKVVAVDMLDHTYGSDNKCTVCGAEDPNVSDEPSYGVVVDQPANGKIKVSSRHAEAGDKVTVTVTPDEGYELVELIVTDSRGRQVELTQKGDDKFTFKMPAGEIEIEAVFQLIDEEEMDNPFVDVDEDAYYFDAVLWALENGITNGMSDNEFMPGYVCNRAQVVTFLWRAAGSPEPESTEMPFEDVPAGAYYYDAVLWAVENGITNGMSATEFAPNATVTRGQTVTFLWRAVKGEVAEGMSRFADVTSDAYYASAVQWAVKNGITNGMSATEFAPNAGCTRGQIVTFLYRTFAE